MRSSPPDESPADTAGAGGAWGPSLGLLAVAVGIFAGALAWWWTSLPDRQVAAVPPPASPAAPAPGPLAPTTPPAAAASATATVAAASPAPASVPPATPGPTIRRNRDPDGDQTPDLSDYVNEGERPTMGQVIERLQQAGVHTGLGAFSPPGTRPPLVGLAVPEGFVLPDGYVRHHQATDDGQRIEPILMFAPDRPVFDAAGRPIAVPPDRLVPPELAPPGLPIRRIVIPAPVQTGSR